MWWEMFSQICVQIIPNHTGERMTTISVQMTKLLQEEFRLSFY